MCTFMYNREQWPKKHFILKNEGTVRILSLPFLNIGHKIAPQCQLLKTYLDYKNYCQ